MRILYDRIICGFLTLSPIGRVAVRPSLPCFLAYFSKLSWGIHTWKFLTLPTFLLPMPIWKKKSKNLVLPPSQSTLKYRSKYRPCTRALKNNENLASDKMRIAESVSQKYSDGKLLKKKKYIRDRMEKIKSLVNLLNYFDQKLYRSNKHIRSPRSSYPIS